MLEVLSQVSHIKTTLDSGAYFKRIELGSGGTGLSSHSWEAEVGFPDLCEFKASLIYKS